ncbi:MAG: prepilin peptidase [Candidatus Staskawiczbacteria bacterium]|nr:prepilin peptidase [Candidatus Staskawiczbacteria bacterium]
MIILSVFVFIFGVCIGSFLNCLIYRMEQNKKATGRSFCPHCKHILSWQDLFPVFSFLLLQGKCRYCQKKISWQYPIVEISTGVLFIFIFLSFGFVSDFGFRASDFIKLCFMLYIASVLIIIFVYDLKHYLIPEKVLFPAIFIYLAYRLSEIFTSNFASFGSYILAAAIASGFFWVIWFFSRGKWMGFGDVELAILMGLLLGLANVLAALFLAFFFGAIISLILLGFYGKNLKSEVPFGPFLITGAFVALMWGQQIIQWYVQLFKI